MICQAIYHRAGTAKVGRLGRGEGPLAGLIRDSGHVLFPVLSWGLIRNS